MVCASLLPELFLPILVTVLIAVRGRHSAVEKRSGAVASLLTIVTDEWGVYCGSSNVV